jgi:multicomponent Na+:H+ antiporter subunit F
MVDVLYTIAGVLLAVTAIVTMYRVIAGPTILDRIIASDVLLTTLILVVATEMIINAHTRTIPLMVILAATAIFGTVAVARFVTKTEGSPWRKDVT